jgi:hypothetical protein
MANYSSTSPWYKTNVEEDFLGILEIRPVAAEPDDFLYTIEPAFIHRPDLLAYAIYGTSRLWWVFIQRNLDVLQDPIYDFVPGTQIFIPQKAALFSSLGL